VNPVGMVGTGVDSGSWLVGLDQLILHSTYLPDCFLVNSGTVTAGAWPEITTTVSQIQGKILLKISTSPAQRRVWLNKKNISNFPLVLHQKTLVRKSKIFMPFRHYYLSPLKCFELELFSFMHILRSYTATV